MKKALLLLPVILMTLFIGCEQMKEEEGNPNSDVSTIEQQIEEIKGSLPKFRAALKSLKSLISDNGDTKSEAETKTVDNNTKGLKQYVELLEERIEALEEYVYSNNDKSKDWLEATYATLEMYQETVYILALIQSELEAMKANMENLDSEVLQKAEENITESITSMKDWVNERLTGYYDIVAIDAKFAIVEESLASSQTELHKEISDNRDALKEALASMETAYKDAIKDAIEENNGVIDTKIANAIADVNARIDKEIADINKKLSDLEDRISQLESSVTDLLNRIQSIAYIPLHEDNKARVNIPYVDMYGSYMSLDFKVSPRSVVNDIASSYNEFLSIKVVPTGTINHFDLPITSCNGNSEEGILQLTVDCQDLGIAFRDENQTFRAILYISDGNNDLTSDYIELAQHFIQCRTRYTASPEFTEADVADLFKNIDAEIISTTFDQGTNYWVTIFNKGFNIEKGAFKNKSNLVSIFIPSGVREIGEEAFSECTNLKRITIPERITSIGKSAFQNCHALEYVTIPQGITSIESNTFLKCYALKQIYIPESVTSIGERAFQSCHALERITIPSGITSIERHTFGSCTALTQINLPESVTSIGMGAFYKCI